MSRVFEGSYAVDEAPSPLPASHWSTKLSALQSQHKKETLQQQRDHLEQLHLLQDQLLEEISLNMNLTARELGVSSSTGPSGQSNQNSTTITSQAHSSSQPHSSSSHQYRQGQRQSMSLHVTDLEVDPSDRVTPFMKSTKTPRSPPPTSRRNTTMFGGHSSPRPCDTTGSVFGSNRYSPIPAWGVELSNDEADVVLSVRCPQHSSTNPSRIIASPCGKVNFAMPVQPNRTVSPASWPQGGWVQQTTPIPCIRHRTNHLRPPTNRSTPQSKGPSPSLSSSYTSPSPPSPHQQHPTPSPPQGCPHSPAHCSYSPPRCQHVPQHCPHSPPHCPLDPIPTTTTTTTTWAGKSQESNFARAALVEKHTKHIDDLKRYYEGEISSLEKKLGKKATPTRRVLDFDGTHGSPTQQQQSGMATPSPRHHGMATPSPHHHGMATPSPCHHRYQQQQQQPSQPRTGELSESAATAKFKALKSEKVRLETECIKLREMLEKSRRQCQMLMEQEKQSEVHIREWHEHCESSEKMVNMLNERLERSRQELQGQQASNDNLQTKLQETTEELNALKTRRSHDIGHMDDFFREYEELKMENERLYEANKAYNAELSMCKGELVSLKATLEKYKTADAKNKSTIHSLEDQVRHLEHIKNRMHGMGTHYQLGYQDYDPPPPASPRERRVPQKLTSKTSPAPSKASPSSQNSPQSNPLMVVKHSPKSPLHAANAGSHGSPVAFGRSATATPSSLRHSPFQHQTPITAPPPHHQTPITAPASKNPNHPQSSNQKVATPSTGRALTRRKWLESSDPGLFGVTNSSSTASDSTFTKLTPSISSLASSSDGTRKSPPSSKSSFTKRAAPSRTSTSAKMNSSAAKTSTKKSPKNSKSGASNEPKKATPPPAAKPETLDTTTTSELKPAQVAPASINALQQPSTSTSLLAGTRYSIDPTVGSGDDSSSNPSAIQLDPIATSVLKAIKEGRITSVEVDEKSTSKPLGAKNNQRKARSRFSMSEEEKFRKHVDTVAETGQKLDRLVAERELLESSLQRSPRLGKATREAKIMQEQRLGEVIHEIGAARMVLKKHNALGPKS